MHIILGLLAVLGGVAFWWWRLKMLGEAASEITDVAGRAWGKYKRNKFRKKVEDSPVESVNDPVAAAAVMMLAVAKTDGPMSDRSEAVIKQIVVEDLQAEDPVELMTFSRWVAGHVTDANDVSRRYAKIWAQVLNAKERRDFLSMVRKVAEADGPASRENQVVLARLRERLGLQA
jgi:uncharacterized tellurite resistance protein B-like protein